MNKFNQIINNKFNSSIPFNYMCENFLKDLSDCIMIDKEARKYTDLISFAFWIRKKNLSKLKNNLLKNNLNIKIGLGLVFHISPANVPINFAYSFIFGLVTGNANIVRLPSKNFEQSKIFLKIYNKISNLKKYKEIKNNNYFVNYDSADFEVTKKFSQIADVRIIWGGDETINEIKKYSSKLKNRDIFFSDRFSLAVLNFKNFNLLTKNEVQKLAENFYNDIFFMDQNACTSPHIVIWVGGHNKKSDKELFWKNISEIAKKKYQLDHVISITKMSDLFSDINKLKNVKNTKNYNNFLIRVEIDKIDNDIEKYNKRFGYIYEYNSKNLDIDKLFNNKKIQTLTYFGFKKEELKKFFQENSFNGVDRIIPVGKAHDISFIWDGYNIFESLTRNIEIK